MVGSNDVPDRGDLVWLTFDPQAGHEQGGRRPALVLSPRQYNAKARLAVVCPITSRKKGYPFEVEVSVGQGAPGVILADHVKNLDWQARKVAFEARVPAAKVAEVLELLRPLLGF